MGAALMAHIVIVLLLLCGTMLQTCDSLFLQLQLFCLLRHVDLQHKHSLLLSCDKPVKYNLRRPDSHNVTLWCKCMGSG